MSLNNAFDCSKMDETDLVMEASVVFRNSKGAVVFEHHEVRPMVDALAPEGMTRLLQQIEEVFHICVSKPVAMRACRFVRSALAAAGKAAPINPSFVAAKPWKHNAVMPSHEHAMKVRMPGSYGPASDLLTRRLNAEALRSHGTIGNPTVFRTAGHPAPESDRAS